MRVGHPFVRGSYSFLAKKEYGALEHHQTGSQNEARPRGKLVVGQHMGEDGPGPPSSATTSSGSFPRGFV